MTKPIYHPIEILIGSENDMEVLKLGKILEFLQECEVPFAISVLSAHRHPAEVHSFCQHQDSEAGDRPLVFLAFAGKLNALAGAVAAAQGNHRPVLAAVLPNAKDPSESRDIFGALANMPPGTAIMWIGYDEHAISNAGIAAVQILAQADKQYRRSLRHALQTRAEKKPWKLQFRTSDTKEN